MRLQIVKRLIVPVLSVVALAAFALTASADTVGPITFEAPTYNPGAPLNNQDDWKSEGAAGSGCAVYDHQLVGAAFPKPAAFGSQSLRISNAVTSGCFGDQTFSKPTLNEAGEPGALNGGMSGGTRQSRFEATWQFVSTVPGAEQPGLSVVASPDRGDGARMSWVQMADTPTGLQVNFYDYRDNAPFGSTSNMPAGCGFEDNFVLTNVASGLSRNVPHTIRVTVDLIPGPRNDVVMVYVDGVLKHTGTSWEDYFRWCESSSESRTVDSVLFRTGGTPAPATSGKGFLIDGLTLSTNGGTPANADACKNDGWRGYVYPRSFKNQGDCIQYVNTGK